MRRRFGRRDDTTPGAARNATRRPVPAWRGCNAPDRRDGFVLLAVLVIVGSALLVVTGLIHFAQGEAAGYAVSRERAQQSVMVHSALEVIVPRLDRQRDRILEGELPELDEQYELYERDGRSAVVRLLSRQSNGLRLEPEAGKLDLNSVDAEQLEATGVFDAAIAERIVQFRDETLGRPFQSVVELLHVEGVTPEMIYGPLEELNVSAAAFAEADAEMFANAGRNSAQRIPGLDEATAADVLTVFSFEPALQRDGRRRINLNVEWSDELARRLDDRFGDGASQIIKGIIDSGVQFDDESVIYTVLHQFEVAPEQWPDIIDAITTEAGEYHFGRLDINTASEEALRGLPTVEPEQASQIVQAREPLRGDQAATIAWPAIEGILEAEQYIQLGDRMTARSWTYRIRFAVGTVDAENPTGPMDGAMIGEVVIDLSAPKPRVAYLRDITMLDLAARIAVHDGVIDGDERRDFEDDRTRDTELGSGVDDEPLADEPVNDWFDDDWEVGTLDPMGDPDGESAMNAADPNEVESPNGEPMRRRIGRWRGR